MNIRHGDLALIEVHAALPAGLTASKSKVIMTGSGGNHHSFDRGTFYPHQDGQTVGYFVAVEGTHLLHPDHGKIVKGKRLREIEIEAKTYRCVKQAEQTHAGMRPVVD